jgi:hypothetical protein
VAFGPVKVTSERREKQWLEQAVAQEKKLEKELQRTNPKPVVWKKIHTEGFGTARNRFYSFRRSI